MCNMSNDDNYTTDSQDDDGRELPADLRRAAEEGRKAKQENAQLKRELAFTRAGISTDDPKMSYFYKGYDGDLEPEKIRSAAVEAGFLQQDPAILQQQQQQAQTLDSQQRVMNASAGAMGEDSSLEAGFAKMEAALSDGGFQAMFDVARQYGVSVDTYKL
jgi:hypothetical protein